MAYNRWLSDDVLEHHGVLGMHWGEQNGPPYPLGSDISNGHRLLKGAGGKRPTSGGVRTKKKTGASVSKAKRMHGKPSGGQKNRASSPEEIQKRKRIQESLKDAKENNQYDIDYLEYVQNEDWYDDDKRMLKEYEEYLTDQKSWLRKMNGEGPTGSSGGMHGKPDDDTKFDLLVGQRWGKPSETELKLEASKRKVEEARREDDELYEKTMAKIEKLNLSTEESDKIFSATANKYTPFDTHDKGRRLDKAYKDYLKNKRAEEKKAQADYEAARNFARDHGTAEEAMKYRDSYTKEEWNEIAGRLEAEARVSKLLAKPVNTYEQSSNQNGNQNQNQNQNQNNNNKQKNSNQSYEILEPDTSNLTAKLKKLYETGTAREVYKQRSKFSIEQLQGIAQRLDAEQIIGNYANNQVILKSNKQLNLQNISETINTVANIASGFSKIGKAFSEGSGKNQNNNNSNNQQKNNNNQKQPKFTEKPGGNGKYVTYYANYVKNKAVEQAKKEQQQQDKKKKKGNGS